MDVLMSTAKYIYGGFRYEFLCKFCEEGGER